jgi:hypothetical protein
MLKRPKVAKKITVCRKTKFWTDYYTNSYLHSVHPNYINKYSKESLKHDLQLSLRVYLEIMDQTAQVSTQRPA